jgi:hypothetical protein
MAEETKEKTAKSEAKAEKAEPTYSPEQLITESRALLGVPRHAAVGAFHGEEREELTLPEAETVVERFLGRRAGGES